MTDRGPGSPPEELTDAMEELADGIVSVLEARCDSTDVAMQILCLAKYRYAARCRERARAVLAEYEAVEQEVLLGFELAEASGFDVGSVTGGGSA